MRETALCAALNDGVDLTQYSLDDVFEGRPSADGTNDAVLTDEDAGIRVVYRCASPFRHWVLYNGSGKEGYISPEPYTWVTNAPNLKLPADITGVRVLEPGRQCRIESTISVTDLER
jgi:aldose 1-epimerase